MKLTKLTESEDVSIAAFTSEQLAASMLAEPFLLAELMPKSLIHFIHLHHPVKGDQVCFKGLRHMKRLTGSNSGLLGRRNKICTWTVIHLQDLFKKWMQDSGRSE